MGVLSPVLDDPTCKVSALYVIRDQSVNRQGKNTVLWCTNHSDAIGIKALQRQTQVVR